MWKWVGWEHETAALLRPQWIQIGAWIPVSNGLEVLTLNVPLPLSLVKCKSDMLPCLHWSIQGSWGVSIMFIHLILHYWKVHNLTGRQKKRKRKSLRRLFVMVNQCISLLKSRGKHRCIYSSHFSDHSNPPPCIPHVNTAAARVSCLISQTIHALSLSFSLSSHVPGSQQIFRSAKCNGCYHALILTEIQCFSVCA